MPEFNPTLPHTLGLPHNFASDILRRPQLWLAAITPWTLCSKVTSSRPLRLSPCFHWYLGIEMQVCPGMEEELDVDVEMLNWEDLASAKHGDWLAGL